MNTKVTRKQVEEARNYLYNINTQLGMTLYDPELAEIIKNREVVEIQGKRYHIESSPLGTLVMVAALWVSNAHREL